MPFNPSGVFIRLYRWVTDRDNSIPIDSTRMDAEIDGMVTGINSIVNQTQVFTGPVKAPGGTISTPGHSFSNDPDTGMYRSAANSMGFSAGGANVFSIAPTVITAAQPLAMGSNKITGLAAPTASSDAARKADVDAMLPLTGGNVSGPIRVPGGSESAPSLQFSNENNGLYWLPGTGPFFTAGGSIIARLTAGTSLSTVDSIVTRQAGDNRYMQQDWTLTAGAGMSGGGTGAANRTISMGTPSSIGDTTSNEVTSGSHTHSIGPTIARSAINIGAGAGMIGGGTLAADRTISMGTPSSITRTSTNSASGNTHTHNLPQADFRDMMANYLDAGTIGSPGFMYCSGSVPVSPGTSRPGSTLYFTNASNNETTDGPQAAGTWMCLGYLSAAGNTHSRKTLWRRIS